MDEWNKHSSPSCRPERRIFGVSVFAMCLSPVAVKQRVCQPPDWCGRRESKRGPLSFEVVGSQFASYLAGAGAVAMDAQIDAALAAIGVLRVAEAGRLHISFSRACLPLWCDGCGHLAVECECGAGAGAAAPDSAERVAVRASSGEPFDTASASRESATPPPSKPVCGRCGGTGEVLQFAPDCWVPCTCRGAA